MGARRRAGARSRRRRARKYNAAIIFKRAQGQGRITRIDGPRRVHAQRYGEHVVEEKLLPPGRPRRNWKHTLLSDGHLVVRHPDHDTAWHRKGGRATIHLYAG